jgi:hypothetical protein
MTTAAWGIVIGIDFYAPGNARPDIEYHNLSGAVGDAGIVEHFLATSLQVPRERIYKLTSSKWAGPSQTEPIEPPNCWPTYENIVNVFQTVIQQARSGEYIYIHYSGHGGRVRTIFGHIKGNENVFDEALVPFNIHVMNGRYIRDLEIASLLQAMVAKGLIVTVVLDCCYSGSATRSQERLQTRGIAEVDHHILESDRQTLVTISSEVINSGKRGAITRDNWLVEPKGYTLLAACKGSERAKEILYHDGKFHGIFTYWLMNTLNLGWTDFTYGMLYNRVRARVHGDNPQQTPVLAGEMDRIFFGAAHILSSRSAVVNRLSDRGPLQIGSIIELSAGNAHLVDVGNEFAICGPPTVTFPQPQVELARVRVKRTRGVVCEAEVISIFTTFISQIDVGCSAILLPVGTNRRKRVVNLYLRPEFAGYTNQQMTLLQLKTYLENNAAYFIELQEQGTGPFDIQITINDRMEFECTDRTGQPVFNSISIFELNAIARLTQRLTHVAKFCNIRDLENPNRQSALANKFRIEVVETISQRNPFSQPHIAANRQNVTGVSEVMNGDTITLHIYNFSSFVINVAVFDLDPLWQVSQVLPQNGDFVEVEPGSFVPLTLTMVTSAPGLWNNVDIIKAFATVQATSFRWLELPSLDQAGVWKSNITPSNELEELCVALTEERRNPAPPISAWETAVAMIRVNDR